MPFCFSIIFFQNCHLSSFSKTTTNIIFLYGMHQQTHLNRMMSTIKAITFKMPIQLVELLYTTCR